MSKPYYCVSVLASAHNRRRDIIITELKKILGDKKAEFVIVDDADLLATGEYYVFIRSEKFTTKHPMIAALQSITLVHCVGQKPYAFPESEVSKFFKDVKIGGERDTLTAGDIVLVRRGYLKNLHGIVKTYLGNKCKVFFWLHTRSFTETINRSWLTKKGTVLSSKPNNVCKDVWLEKFLKPSTGKKRKSK